MKFGFKTLVSVFFLGIAIGFLSYSAGLQNFFNSNSNLTGFSIAPANSVKALFCPRDFCANQLVQKIDSAKQTIDVAIYSFTLEEIHDALIRAKNRGVTVRVLFDFGQAKSQYSVDEAVRDAGIHVRYLDLERGLLHDKFVVVDKTFVSTGSFNFSQNADEYNKENLVFISNSTVANEFAAEFESLWNQAG